MLKFNEKYNRWFSDKGEVFKYDSIMGEMVPVKGSVSNAGYLAAMSTKHFLFHRAIWETFNGEIPKGMVIDHKNGNRLDNSLDNLQCVTQKENVNNPVTKIKLKEACKNNGHDKRCNKKYLSDIGLRFLEHFGIYPCQDKKLYQRENGWRLRHGHFKWEV